MGRAILGVVVGYVVMFVVVFVLLTGAYFALGTDGAFKEGSFEPSTPWVIIMFLVGLLAAIIGGFVCTKIAPRTGPLYGLIVVIAVLGLVSVGGSMAVEDPGPRSSDLSSMEAMMKATTPVWVNVGNIVVGILGALYGGRLGLKGKRA